MGTSQFVVPATGYWNYNISVYPYRLGGANTYCVIIILINGTTAYRMYELDYENMQTLGELMVNGSILLNSTMGDVVEVQCAVGGAGLNVGFGGTASFCRFSGVKVG